MSEAPSQRPSPLQNRVTPTGEIVATPHRGMFTGNRGILHNANKELTARRWTSSRWITCLIDFQGRKMELMAPHQWTQLFFLDEATAFAAGHRPCAYCRRPDFNRFLAAWAAGSLRQEEVRQVRASTVDSVLHRERLTPARTKRTFTASPGDLPDGTVVTLPRDPGEAWLIWAGALLQWSPGGYVHSRPLPATEAAQVLTPRSVVSAFFAGYQPTVHPSALLPLPA